MNLTKVDWLGFRSKGSVTAVIDALKPCLGLLGGQLQGHARSGGWMGYESSADLVAGGVRMGLMAFGGEAQRGWVSVHLSGTGCQWVGDWGVAQDSLSALPGMQVRRVDVALDTIDPAVVAHDVVVAAHRQGMFSTRGRPPSMRQILPEDPAEGRTVYIGQRDQAKFFRGYEKGYELARAFPKHVQPSHIDGVPIGNLYRCELELKVKDAPLPVDLIDRRDQYFAGAYPFLGHVLKVEPEILVQRREREPELLLQAALARVRQQYGRTLFTALAAYHGDFMAVWDKVVGSQHNMDLVQAGVLLAEHD